MNKKILLADDDRTSLNLVLEHLKSNGYDVLTASEGQEAFRRAKTENPDLIILDLMLPKMDGYRICRFLKSDDNYRHIPVIIFTSRPDSKNRGESLGAGADAYLTKPLQPAKLLSTIKDLLAKMQQKD
jgi:DNA-binding response OmpR family regulator